MTDTRLDALSPLDGRYAAQTRPLAELFSEAALIRYRVRVEALWFKHLATLPAIPELSGIPEGVGAELDRLAAANVDSAASRVK